MRRASQRRAPYSSERARQRRPAPLPQAPPHPPILAPAPAWAAQSPNDRDGMRCAGRGLQLTTPSLAGPAQPPLNQTPLFISRQVLDGGPDVERPVSEPTAFQERTE